MVLKQATVVAGTAGVVMAPLAVPLHLMPSAADRMRQAIDHMLTGEADGPATAQA